MSIAHVVYSLGTGGQERVVLDLAAAQSRAGHAVRIVVLSEAVDGDMEAEFAQRNIPVVRVIKGKGFRPDLIGRLWRVFRKEGVSIVHTHNPMPLIYGVPAAKLARCGLVHTKHGEHRDSPRRMLLRRRSGQWVDAFVAVSTVTADFATRHRECRPDRLQIIVNGTDLSRFTEGEDGAAVREQAGIPADAVVITCVGRFVPEKDQEALVAAVEPLLGASCHLLFAGHGPLETSVKEQAQKSANAASIHFLGRRTDIPRVLAASDIYAVSSKTEGLPIGLIEAMASGLAIVSTEVGGIPGALRSGELGILVPSQDRSALTAALRELVDHPDKRKLLGDKAKKAAVEDFGAERMHREYESVYREISGKS